ncbi:hypothetical protein, partial [Paenibacillus elgii]|uniref:hypothetical protein n=1 Tax=Paenibacillus elgii TaxID=189691 RepID=UPI001ED92DB6
TLRVRGINPGRDTLRARGTNPGRDTLQAQGINPGQAVFKGRGYRLRPDSASGARYHAWRRTFPVG